MLRSWAVLSGHVVVVLGIIGHLAACKVGLNYHNIVLCGHIDDRVCFDSDRHATGKWGFPYSVVRWRGHSFFSIVGFLFGDARVDTKVAVGS